ncbi:MAG TPA: hypothetical protein VEA69_25585 [Tepidisphaeraceae bacterium]|nr:hypothetical protein [Tepidisphaeraceae bacterium]
MTLFDKIPGWLKAAIFLGVVAIAPVVLVSILVAGRNGLIFAVIAFLVYFIVLYITGIRRYSGDR